MGNFFRSVLGAAAALLQSKSVTATTSQQTVLPDNGYDGLSQVTVNPQSHTGTVTLSAKYETGNGYDMGDNHANRYVKTSGLIVTPTATKSITANGTYDVTDYASAQVNVPGSAFVSNGTIVNSNSWGTGSAPSYSYTVTTAGYYLVIYQCSRNNTSVYPNVSLSTTGTIYGRQYMLAQPNGNKNDRTAFMFCYCNVGNTISVATSDYYEGSWASGSCHILRM